MDRLGNKYWPFSVFDPGLENTTFVFSDSKSNKHVTIYYVLFTSSSDTTEVASSRGASYGDEALLPVLLALAFGLTRRAFSCCYLTLRLKPGLSKIS